MSSRIQDLKVGDKVAIFKNSVTASDGEPVCEALVVRVTRTLICTAHPRKGDDECKRPIQYQWSRVNGRQHSTLGPGGGRIEPVGARSIATLDVVDTAEGWWPSHISMFAARDRRFIGCIRNGIRDLVGLDLSALTFSATPVEACENCAQRVTVVAPRRSS